MWMLTRRVGETVMVGPDITVTVLGVQASPLLSERMLRRKSCVGREEIDERIQRETRPCATWAPAATHQLGNPQEAFPLSTFDNNKKSGAVWSQAMWLHLGRGELPDRPDFLLGR
jgi:carbon storage regulator